jgi:hypothetical protein
MAPVHSHIGSGARSAHDLRLRARPGDLGGASRHRLAGSKPCPRVQFGRTKGDPSRARLQGLGLGESRPGRDRPERCHHQPGHPPRLRQDSLRLDPVRTCSRRMDRLSLVRRLGAPAGAHAAGGPRLQSVLRHPASRLRLCRWQIGHAGSRGSGVHKNPAPCAQDRYPLASSIRGIEEHQTLSAHPFPRNAAPDRGRLCWTASPSPARTRRGRRSIAARGRRVTGQSLPLRAPGYPFDHLREPNTASAAFDGGLVDRSRSRGQKLAFDT